MKLLKHVRPFTYVEPGETAKAMIESRRKFRHGCLSDLKVPGICKWCEKIPLKKGNRLYCGNACRESAVIAFNPQKPTAKAYLLIYKQNFSCGRCKEDFSDELDSILWRKLTHWIPDLTVRPITDRDVIDLYNLAIDTGDRWHVDHIIPIHKGGAGVGLDNVQVLCVRCHHLKTAEERKK